MESQSKVTENAFRFRNAEASKRLEEQEIYRKIIEVGKANGCYLDKILYPSSFGPSGELLGIAVACDIQPGETIMSVPCSYRIDLTTIMSSEIG
jgi:hypothetical protein